MLNVLLSPTKFVSFVDMSPGDLAQAVFFVGEGRNPGTGLRVVLVRDSRASPMIDELGAGLAARYDLVVLDRIQPNPLARDISIMADECDLARVDVVVGIGGGSTMDSAKALAMLAGNGGDLEGYLGPSPARTVQRKGRPLILVPTTAGTGSEATKVGVYTAASGRKFTLASPYLQADAALLSGSLAASMPPVLVASTGFDALSHALESLWNKNATPVTIEAATEAAVMILKTLPTAYDAAVKTATMPTDGASKAAMTATRNGIALKMLEAAASAGIAFSITGTALVHALSFVLSEDWHVPHGTACAFTLEDAYRLQAVDPEIESRLAAIGVRLYPDTPGSSMSIRLLDRIIALKKEMKLPSKFSDLGISINEKLIVQSFGRAFDDLKMANSYPVVSPAQIYSMLGAKK